MIPNKKRMSLAIFLGVLGLLGLSLFFTLRGVRILFLSDLALILFKQLLGLFSLFVAVPGTFLAWGRHYFSSALWCVSSVWLGVAAWLWHTRCDQTEGILKIIFYHYFFIPLLLSPAVFVLSYSFDAALGFKFYSAAFPLGLLLGFLAKDLWSLLPRWMEGKPR